MLHAAAAQRGAISAAMQAGSRLLVPAAATLLLTLVAALMLARGTPSAAPGGLEVTEAWARATPPGAVVGAAYLTIENHADRGDRLIAATSPVASHVSVHVTVAERGTTGMRPLEGAAIAAGGTLRMAPGGTHMMLSGLSGPLVAGRSLPLTLVFENAGAVTVAAAIAPIGAEAPAE
jgi:copper(I)-binding protein